MKTITYPEHGLPYFAALPYYLWGEINYDSEGDCKNPLDREWSCLEVYNRIYREKYFKIRVSDDKKTLTIDGDEESVEKIKEFFSKTPNKEGLKRVKVVNYCFEHPAMQKFSNGHYFWGSWKWIGTMATDFTYVGRWLMLDAMRNSDFGAWLALNWYDKSLIQFGPESEKTKALADHLREACHVHFVNSQPMVNKQYKEPNAKKWEKELLEFYKIILEKFDCLDDPMMLYENNETEDDVFEDTSTEDSSEDEYSGDLLADSWSVYGIDIYSKDAIQKFADMGFDVLERDEGKELDACTFAVTGELGTAQASYKCPDCFLKDFSASICEFCIEECKKQGHNISDIKYVPGFCDKQLRLTVEE